MVSIFYSCFCYPTYPHPPLHEPPAALPATPQHLQGSTNGRLSTAFLPRDKNFQVWCNHSHCLSCCFTCITCSMPNHFTSQGYRFGKAKSVTLVATPGLDNCMSGEVSQKNIITHASFIYHSVVFKMSCIYKYCIPKTK